MARCTVCKKTSEEVRLFTGIMGAEMVIICESCSEDQKVPIIRRPSQSQLREADKRYSVRERMEIMSGVRDATEISEDQIVTQGNLARLRSPPKKQTHEDVLENYYWTLSMARRRKKLTLNHLAQKMQVNPKIIQGIERGVLPPNFQELFLKLESYLGINLLKMRTDKVNFVRTNREAEKEILNAVRNKMQSGEDEDESEEEEVESDDEDEELEITSKKDLTKITISDLLGRKRRREAREKKRREKEETQSMMGEDIDLEIEEF